MTNAKWLIAVDMANVLMENVFVPEDTLDKRANKVSTKPLCHRVTMLNCRGGVVYHIVGN
jgi:hypothetical protein